MVRQRLKREWTMTSLKTLGIGAVAACAGLFFFTNSAFAGPEWVERNDAGSLYGNAQSTLGSGQLGRITGSLDGTSNPGFRKFRGPSDTEDMFLITVTDPSSFTMTVSGANFDPQIFIFNVTLPGEAFGLLANDDTSSRMLPFIGQFSTDGSGAQINLPGVYAIAISGTGRNPVAFNNNLLFNYTSSTEVSGPDGPGGFLPHAGWIGDGPTGDYMIDFTGAGFYDVPAPGAIGLLTISIFSMRRRRR